MIILKHFSLSLKCIPVLAINAQLRAQIAAQAAANAAAQINAKLGLAGTAMQANPAAMAGMGGIGFSTTEIVDVPDKMVGLGMHCDFNFL